MKLTDIYAMLPKLECQGKCSGSCGIIPLSAIEFRHLNRPEVPHQVVVDMDDVILMPPHTAPNLTCPVLTDDKRCGNYDARPLMCRLWGIVPEMACPFGCKPERYLSYSEVHFLMNQVRGATL